MTKTIQLTQNKETLVDDNDYNWLNNFKWQARKGINTWYACRKSKGSVIYLHRLLLYFPDGQVDHINGNGLDNRRGNLRVASPAQQTQNRPSKTRSGYKGVGETPNGRWKSQIQVKKKSIHLGTFDTPEEAARHYDEAALFYFGENARTNFGTNTN